MLIPAYILSITLMILLPVALAAWLRRLSLAPWLLFSAGCLTFIVSQVVHLPLNSWLADLGLLPGQAAPDLPVWRTALTLGLTAGLCEELARAAGYVLLRRLKPAWMRLQDGIMLGLGHGGFEAMVVGGVLTAAQLSALLPLHNVNLDTLGLPPEQVEFLSWQLNHLYGNPLNAGLPLLERLLAISAHVVFSLMVWKAFTGRRSRSRWLYLPLAIAYHAAIDFVAVWFAQTYRENLLLLMLAFAGILVPGWIWAAWTIRGERGLRRRPYPAAEQNRPGGRPEEALRGEFGVFWTSVLKELRQLWRTKRLLIMAAVFLIFGMGSPLLAKFTPQILRSFEEAKMFADLIPEPTAGDAMAQYIENLSQFGFILAVLMGMGTVAGEKERGIAPMILSKAMPRWAFIAGKFSAQFLMYLGVFFLSGLGAYYYTLVLFGTLEAGSFALLNTLLLAWLLTFVALSLLGSTLGSSTVAGGGISLALSVALMLAGSLPVYGALLPAGLLGWAGQLGQAAAGVAATTPGAAQQGAQAAANGGALASAAVVVVLALVLSVGVFEQQEL